MNKTKAQKQILLMGWLTLLGFPAIGVLVVYIFENHPLNFPLQVLQPCAWYTQLIVGSVIGSIMGFVSWRIVQLPQLEKVKTKYGGMITSLKLNPWHIWFLSLCAGIGEELFFRGVLQFYWGVPITAIVFVAIHGYLNITNLPLFGYGVVMTLFIAILGYLYNYMGLITPIAAHTFIDIVLLTQLSKRPHITWPKPHEVDVVAEE